MDIDDLNFLPDWDDEPFNLNEDDEGEEWKTASARGATKAMYLKWREVFGLIMAFAEYIADDAKEHESESETQMTRRFIYENAMIVAPKIMGAAGSGMYVLQMENAAIIRTNCRQLMEQVVFAVMQGDADETQEQAIQEGMEEFRELFKKWVATFVKDEFEDEWGLFV
ncbi:MAG: hypothetical protein ACHQK8_06870 [Bacteroidia bacterium]